MLAFVLAMGCGHAGRVAATPATDALEQQLPLDTRVTTLPNGLKIVVQEDHHTPVVALRLTYRVGSGADPKGRAGFAHLFEHMMFEGSKHVARGEFESTMTSLGGNYNAETTVDFTSYHETFPKHALDKVLWLESDRMGFLLDRLDQKMLDDVRGVVKNEYRQRLEGQPYASLVPAMYAALFPPEHPYHRSPAGSLAELDAASVEDARAFFARWYAPNNATLVLVGDLDANDAIAKVRHWFGAIPAGPAAPEIPKLPPPQLDADRRITLEAGVDLPRIAFAWAVPAYGEPGDVELQSASNILRWRMGGVLIKDKELAHSVTVRHFPGRFGGTVVASAVLVKDANIDKAIAALDVAVDDVSRWARWTMDDKNVKASLYGEFAGEVFDFDGPSARAASLSFYDLMFENPTGMVVRLRNFERLGSDEVVDAYRTWILRSHRVTAVVKPNPDAPVSGKMVEER